MLISFDACITWLDDEQVGPKIIGHDRILNGDKPTRELPGLSRDCREMPLHRRWVFYSQARRLILPWLRSPSCECEYVELGMRYRRQHLLAHYEAVLVEQTNAASKWTRPTSIGGMSCSINHEMRPMDNGRPRNVVLDSFASSSVHLHRSRGFACRPFISFDPSGLTTANPTLSNSHSFGNISLGYQPHSETEYLLHPLRDPFSGVDAARLHHLPDRLRQSIRRLRACIEPFDPSGWE